MALSLFSYLNKTNYFFIMAIAIIILVVVVLLVIWGVSLYNNLVKLRNNRENAFANIDVQLKQRHDLVPQLVSTVKGYATHEREVLQRVTEARTAAMGATGINDKINETELSDLENKLAAARRFFNSTTRELNNAVETFPSNIFAKMFKFGKEPMFEVPQEERAVYDKAPEIKF